MSTTPYGAAEVPFNLPAPMAAARATYMALRTVLDKGRLSRSLVEAVRHRG